jgi:anti-sigma factor RsiW
MTLMKCEDASNELIAYAGRRTDAARSRQLEKHLAGCTACRTRVEEFRALSNVLDELPSVEPSFAFDARVRQRVAAEPERGWFGRLVPQPRLALSAAMLVLLCVWVVRMEPYKMGTSVPPSQAAMQQEDFNAIQNLDVLENYDVLTKFEALAEAPAAPASQQDKTQQDGGKAND